MPLIGRQTGSYSEPKILLWEASPIKKGVVGPDCRAAKSLKSKGEQSRKRVNVPVMAYRSHGSTMLKVDPLLERFLDDRT
jgi:hypothetical protein